MTCYQLNAPFSGSKWGLGGNTQALTKHPQTVQTVHFLEGWTPFCTVCTQWRGNTMAQTQSPNLPYSKGVGSLVVALLIWWAS